MLHSMYPTNEGHQHGNQRDVGLGCKVYEVQWFVAITSFIYEFERCFPTKEMLNVTRINYLQYILTCS